MGNSLNLKFENDNELLKSEFMEFVLKKGCNYYSEQDIVRYASELKKSIIEKGIGEDNSFEKGIQDFTMNLDSFIVINNRTGFKEKMYIEKVDTDIEKGGKRAVIGEIRTWDGVKYQKTANGWDLYKDKKTESKKDDNKEVESKKENSNKIERLKLLEKYKHELEDEDGEDSTEDYYVAIKELVKNVKELDSVDFDELTEKEKEDIPTLLENKYEGEFLFALDTGIDSQSDDRELYAEIKIDNLHKKSDFYIAVESIDSSNNIETVKYFFKKDEKAKDEPKDTENKELTIEGNVLKSVDKNVTSVKIPDTVKEIGYGAFTDSDITSVTIPDSVEKIGDNAFFRCTKLKSVTIPNSVKEIGWKAFSSNYSLESVTIPNSVEKIEEWAFKGCDKLESVHIPNPETIINKDAFPDYTKITYGTKKETEPTK